MKKTVLAFAAAISVVTFAAQAGGWGHHGDSGNRGGLINISPKLGDIDVLNGLSVMDDSAILSGINVSGILNGNDTGNGILSGIGLNLLGGNHGYKLRRH